MNKTIKEILREVSMVLDEQFSGTNWYRGVDIQLKDFIGSLLSRIEAQTRAEDLAAAEELKKELEGMDMDINAADAIHKFFEKLQSLGGEGMIVRERTPC